MTTVRSIANPQMRGVPRCQPVRSREPVPRHHDPHLAGGAAGQQVILSQRNWQQVPSLVFEVPQVRQQRPVGEIHGELSALVQPHLLVQRFQAAFADPRPARVSPFSLGLLAFVAGSAFHLVAQFGSAFLSSVAVVVIALMLPAVVISAVRMAVKAGVWTNAHTDSLVLGGVLAYCWLGFFLTARLHGASTIPGQLFPCIIVLGLVYFAFVHRRAERKNPGPGPAG